MQQGAAGLQILKKFSSMNPGRLRVVPIPPSNAEQLMERARLAERKRLREREAAPLVASEEVSLNMHDSVVDLTDTTRQHTSNANQIQVNMRES